MAIVKSRKALLAANNSSNEMNIKLFGGLEETTTQLEGMDQAIRALFEIKDKLALSEIVSGSSVFLHLRKKAKQYLEELETG